MTKRLFIARRHRIKECLELVHIDMCEPFSAHILGGYGYFINFIDEYSRFGYVYLLHRKSDVLDKFIEFKVELITYWVHISMHFELIKVICLGSIFP